MTAVFDDAPWFNEFAIRLPGNAAAVIDALVDDGILAGVALKSVLASAADTDLLVVATEKTMPADIKAFAAALSTHLKEGQA